MWICVFFPAGIAFSQEKGLTPFYMGSQKLHKHVFHSDDANLFDGLQPGLLDSGVSSPSSAAASGLFASTYVTKATEELRIWHDKEKHQWKEFVIHFSFYILPSLLFSLLFFQVWKHLMFCQRLEQWCETGMWAESIKSSYRESEKVIIKWLLNIFKDKWYY